MHTLAPPPMPYVSTHCHDCGTECDLLPNGYCEPCQAKWAEDCAERRELEEMHAKAQSALSAVVLNISQTKHRLWVEMERAVDSEATDTMRGVVAEAELLLAKLEKARPPRLDIKGTIYG